MKRGFALLLVALSLCAVARAAGHPPDAGTAPQYADVDTHPNERISIAADPFDTEDRIHFFRIDYLKFGLMPIRIIVTNNSDRPISLDDVRMQFLSAENDRLPAANPDEINRRVNNEGNPMDRKLNVPFPLPHGSGPDKKIADDMYDFGFPGTQVEPHSTLSGFLLYDVHDLRQPVLRGAQIYVKMVKDHDGNQLFPFTIDLDKMQAKP